VGMEYAALTMSSTSRSLLFRAQMPGLVALLTLLCVPACLHDPARGLPYHDSFSSGSTAEWRALGGTWEVVNGAMRNDSDERGAKLLTGPVDWRDYSVESDIMLLGQDSDAGLILRSSDEEEGVDSYTGYYAGLRSLDNSLVLGHAEHGWMERVIYLDSSRAVIQPFHWYHLKLLAYGCEIVAEASSATQGPLSSSAIFEKDCVVSGRVGLRSYAAGGVWKNVTVRPAAREDLAAMLARTVTAERTPGPASPANRERYRVGTPSDQRTQQGLRPATNTESIDSLRLFPLSKATTATIRGAVILTSPTLFVQDSSGGVSVPDPTAPPLKIGDVVEVSGEVHPGDFSSSLEHATVRVLWVHNPVPAVSVTASQAASGAFDANFVELEGTLRAKSYGSNNTLLFDLDSGPQTFRAITNRGRGDIVFNNIKLNSLLRLRGICVVDPAYTRNLTPFVLLLRSADDLKVLAGPPWWNTGNLIATFVVVIAFAFVGIFLYGRIENWRLRAVMGERERLAHEMHDTLAQSFAGIGFQLEAVRNGIPSDLPVAHHQLDLAGDLVKHSHEEARRSIAMLRPEPLRTGNLLTALESCAREMVEGGAVQVVARCSGEPQPAPLRITDTLYRIGQEAIANAVSHADPTTITISLEYRKNLVHLLLADDGKGFDESENLRGFGLRGMRKRAASIAAALRIESTLAQGTRVQITAPLPPRITILSWPGLLRKYLMEMTHVQGFGG
jgi:signal transduction histidine kinase